MDNDKDVVNRQKAQFYFQERLICHVRKKPDGFVNGYFESDLVDDFYYEFEDIRFPEKKVKIFLSEIFDINDYEDPR